MEKTKPTVQLSDNDGNAMSIIGRASRALRQAGYSKEEIDQYRKEAMSGDYDNMIQVTMKWCEVE